MKIKIKDDTNFKLKGELDELVLIENSLIMFMITLNTTADGECEKVKEVINNQIFDYQEFDSCEDLLEKLNKLAVKIKKKMQDVNPY